MSEDVKPRKLFILIDDRNYYDLLAFESLEKFNSFEDEMSELEERKKFKPIPFIELEPTMRLMDDLSKKIEEIENYLNFRTDDLVGDDIIGDKRHTIRFHSLLESINKTLEKYKKFKEVFK